MNFPKVRIFEVLSGDDLKTGYAEVISGRK